MNARALPTVNATSAAVRRRAQSVANRAGYLRAAAVFAIGVGVMWLFPLSRFVMFPYDLLAMKDAAGHWRHLLVHRDALALGCLQWSLAALIFAVLARKERTALLPPLALAGFTLVTIVMDVGVRLLGMDFYLNLNIWH